MLQNLKKVVEKIFKTLYNILQLHRGMFVDISAVCWCR